MDVEYPETVTANPDLSAQEILTTPVPASPLVPPLAIDYSCILMKVPEGGPKIGSYIPIVYGTVHYGARVVLFDDARKLHRIRNDGDEIYWLTDVDYISDDSAEWHYTEDHNPSRPAALCTLPNTALHHPTFLVGRIIQSSTPTKASIARKAFAFHLVESHRPQIPTKCTEDPETASLLIRLLATQSRE